VARSGSVAGHGLVGTRASGSLCAMHETLQAHQMASLSCLHASSRSVTVVKRGGRHGMNAAMAQINELSQRQLRGPH